MLEFLKNLANAIYDATVGGLVRLVRNTFAATVDAQDKQFISRVLVYVGFFTFAIFFPQVAVMVALLRMLLVLDVFNTLATIYQLTANAYIA